MEDIFTCILIEGTDIATIFDVGEGHLIGRQEELKIATENRQQEEENISRQIWMMEMLWE